MDRCKCGNLAVIKRQTKFVPGGRREGVDWSDADVRYFCDDCWEDWLHSEGTLIQAKP